MPNEQRNASATRKTEIAAADLFVLIDREFRRRRTKDCDRCFVQIPYRVHRDPALPNWEVLVPPPCPLGCNLLMEEVVHEHQQRYVLRNGSGHR